MLRSIHRVDRWSRSQPTRRALAYGHAMSAPRSVERGALAVQELRTYHDMHSAHHQGLGALAQRVVQGCPLNAMLTHQWCCLLRRHRMSPPELQCHCQKPRHPGAASCHEFALRSKANVAKDSGVRRGTTILQHRWIAKLKAARHQLRPRGSERQHARVRLHARARLAWCVRAQRRSVLLDFMRAHDHTLHARDSFRLHPP